MTRAAPARTLDLLTAASPADPVLDVAITHALLRDVAAGRRGPALRVFRPPATAAFGRLDALRPGFPTAREAARRHGFTPVLRSAGGHAAFYDPRCLVVEHVTAEEHVTAGLQERFATQAQLVRDALAGLGADARIGELPGEYCPGAFSLNVAGRLKVAGIAQRAVRGAALTTAVVVVAGGAEVRAVIEAVYAALAIDVDPSVAGSLDETLRGVTVEQVARAIEERYARAWRLRPVGLDDELVAGARELAERHRLP